MPTDEVYPENYNDFRRKIREIYNKEANWVNQRILGVFEQTEFQNGVQFFTNDPPSGTDKREPRDGYRKVFEIGSITSGSTSMISHGISGNPFFPYHIYGTVETSATDFRPLPYVNGATVTDQIEITVDSTNIIISNGSTAPDIVMGFVVLEYLKN